MKAIRLPHKLASDEEAQHIAAYINAHDRPVYTGKAEDYPGGAPVDAVYYPGYPENPLRVKLQRVGRVTRCGEPSIRMRVEPSAGTTVARTRPLSVAGRSRPSEGMIGTVRRIHLLTALALLLSGLLQPLAAAQGMTCARTHAPAQDARQPTGVAVDGSASAPDGTRAVSAPHQHDSIPQPDVAGAPSAPCGVAVIPSEQRVPAPAVTARRLLHVGDLPPASLLIQSLFRPPRLS